MKKMGFRLEQGYILTYKKYDNAESSLGLEGFSVEKLAPSYEELKELPYIKRRNVESFPSHFASRSLPRSFTGNCWSKSVTFL